MPTAAIEALCNCSTNSDQPAGSLLTEEHGPSGKIMTSNRSFDTSIPPKESIAIFVSLSCSRPGNCSGMEEATGAPSSIAVFDPKRLRASGRDGDTVMTRPPSPLTMLFSRHTKRREVITLLGGAAVWPLTARGQQPAMPVIGFLDPTSSETSQPRLRGLRQGLKDTGYAEGENVAIV